MNAKIKIKSVLAIYYVLIFSFSSNAQTMILPDRPDNYWYSYPSGFSDVGINTAMIAGGAGHIISAVSTYSNMGAYGSRIYVKDPTLGSAAQG